MDREARRKKLESLLQRASTNPEKHGELVSKIKNELAELDSQDIKEELEELEKEKILTPPSTQTQPEPTATPEPTPPVEEKKDEPTITPLESLLEPEEKTLDELLEEIETKLEEVNDAEKLRELMKTFWKLRTIVSEKIEVT